MYSLKTFGFIHVGINILISLRIPPSQLIKALLSPGRVAYVLILVLESPRLPIWGWHSQHCVILCFIIVKSNMWMIYHVALQDRSI